MTKCLRPWAGSQFRDENALSYCTGGTSYFSNSRSWACLGAGALRLLYFLSFYNRPSSLISMPLVSSQVPSFVPQEKKSARCYRFESLSDSGFIAPNMAFYGLTRLEQTFHWLISVSRDYRSPTALFPIHLLLIIHLDKGSLVPPCAHMAGPRSPCLLHYLLKVVGYFVPHPRFSFLVPDPRSSLQILAPPSPITKLQCHKEPFMSSLV